MTAKKKAAKKRSAGTKKNVTPAKKATKKKAFAGSRKKKQARRAKGKTATRAKNTSRKPAAAKRRPGEQTFRVARGAQEHSGEQSGDLQGLSDIERADSESVDELLEDGDAFEAGIVEAVEGAEDADVSEVRTREVPEDDVPEEYLDED